MPKLLYHVGACSLAPHIVLEWIGAPYETQAVEFGSAELFAINPSGAVPALIEDDGWILTQAGAILHYLAHKHPAADLAGDTSARGAAEMDRWSSFFTGDLHPSFYPIFTPTRYTTSRDKADLDAVQEAVRKLVRRQLGILNAHLEGKDWILGKRSVIDAYSFPMLRWAIGQLPEKLADWPNVQALHDRMAADEAVKRVLAREQGK